MTNLERIQANNVKLDECIEKANNLPDASGGGGSSEDSLAALLQGTITDYYSAEITQIRNHSFMNATNFVSIDVPNCISIGQSAFQGSGLVNTNFPKVESIGNSAFAWCHLTSIKMPCLTEIAARGFYYCQQLTTLIISQNTSVCTLANTDGLKYTPIEKGTGYIYVPRALIADYQVATNWVTFATQFRAIEDYPNICG